MGQLCVEKGNLVNLSHFMAVNEAVIKEFQTVQQPHWALEKRVLLNLAFGVQNSDSMRPILTQSDISINMSKRAFLKISIYGAF